MADAELHTLSKSSLPGKVPPIPSMPDRTADDPRRVKAQPMPDVEVIDLAERLKRLWRRQDAVYGRVQGLVEQVEAAHPEPEAPVSNEDFRAYQAEIRPTEERIGLMLLRKVSGRQSARQQRWLKRLTASEPRTLAGIASKADVLLTIRDMEGPGGFDDFDVEIDKLAESHARDTVRLAKATVDLAFVDDADLLSLIAQHGPALEEWRVADEASDLVRDAYWKVEPARPQALYGRLSDGTLQRRGIEKIEGSTCGRTYYTEADVERLRTKSVTKLIKNESPAPWDPMDTVVTGERVPDHRGEARRIEIITAWDEWVAAKKALKESTGLNAANAVCEVIGNELNRIEDAIFDLTPKTFEGLQAKARWIASIPDAKVRAKHLMDDLCRMGTVALPVQAEAAPTRDVLESYRTFLYMELRLLNAELYGNGNRQQSGFYLVDPVGRFHGSDEPPPSTRAASVLGMFGLMPHGTELADLFEAQSTRVA